MLNFHLSSNFWTTLYMGVPVLFGKSVGNIVFKKREESPVQKVAYSKIKEAMPF